MATDCVGAVMLKVKEKELCIGLWLVCIVIEVFCLVQRVLT